ncbi:hypothetical protein SprV_0401548900 [Sparganum proliferum]
MAALFLTTPPSSIAGVNTSRKFSSLMSSLLSPSDVLLRRFLSVLGSGTRPNQAGFRRGCGCAEHIPTPRHILEFRDGQQQPTASCFADPTAKLHSVHRGFWWRLMELDGVPAKINAMIKASYRSNTALAPVHNNLSQRLNIRSDARQGRIMPLILFKYAAEGIIAKALQRFDGVEFEPRRWLTDLDDDSALLASSFGDLQSLVSEQNEVTTLLSLSKATYARHLVF